MEGQQPPASARIWDAPEFSPWSLFAKHHGSSRDAPNAPPRTVGPLIRKAPWEFEGGTQVLLWSLLFAKQHGSFSKDLIVLFWMIISVSV